VAAVKTVSVLNAVDASLLSMAKATLLLPFLKSATTVRLCALYLSLGSKLTLNVEQAEEQTISDNLLRIFRAAVLASPKTSTKFGKDLQASLLPMLNKPSGNPQVRRFCASFRSFPSSPLSSIADPPRSRRLLLRRRPQSDARLHYDD
jgi:cohesin loading factor subunit SCC2